MKKGRVDVLFPKKHSTLENTRSLQVASWNNDGPVKCMFASNPWKDNEHIQLQTARKLKLLYPLRNGWLQLLSLNKETLFPGIKRSNLEGKVFFRNNYYFSKLSPCLWYEPWFRKHNIEMVRTSNVHIHNVISTLFTL